MFDYEKSWQGDWNDTTRYGPACRHRRRIVAKLARRLPHGTICDLGCGDGRLLSELSRTVTAEFFGSDISAEAVEQARQNLPDAKFEQMELSTAVPDRPFDVVILSEVLEHIEDDADLVRRLAPVACHLVISVPGGPADKVDRRYGHFRNYHGDTLKHLLEENGFDVVFFRRWGFPLYELTQALLNRCGDAESVAGGTYSAGKKFVAAVLYYLFFLNVAPRGSQVFAVGRSKSNP